MSHMVESGGVNFYVKGEVEKRLKCQTIQLYYEYSPGPSSGVKANFPVSFWVKTIFLTEIFLRSSQVYYLNKQGSVYSMLCFG